jgi:multisubunit Na+/H+ antiporter MnhB subunit
MFALAFVFGFAYRWLARKFVKAKPGTRPAGKNINTSGRLLRAGIGLALLLLAIFTTWHPLLLFASGFSFFEAIFSWCIYNQLLGKNSCPI